MERVQLDTQHLKKNQTATDVCPHLCAVCSPDVAVWTSTVTVTLLRLLLTKITVFNTMMTIYAVIKW